MPKADDTHTGDACGMHPPLVLPSASGAVAAWLAALSPVAAVGQVLGFPAQPRHVAALADAMERMPAQEALPLAGAALAIAQRQAPYPFAAAASQHAAFVALLACARYLDDAGYPWQAIGTPQPVTALLRMEARQ